MALIRLAAIVTTGLLAVLTGCSTYIPPGPKADLQAMAPPDIRAGFDLKPTAPFPAGVAAVRVQGGGYRDLHTARHGGVVDGGRYSVVLEREAGEEAQFARIAQLPEVAGVASLNRMRLPEQVNGERDLRVAASRLQADLLLLYTFSTRFHDANDSRLLTTISLGFGSTKRIQVASTASALLIDTRTGYLYSAYETTKEAEASSSVWDSADSADALRRQTEADALAALVGEIEKTWPRLLARYRKQS